MDVDFTTMYELQAKQMKKLEGELEGVQDRLDRLAIKVGVLDKANKTREALREVSDALEALLIVIDAWDEVEESGLK